MTEGAGGGITPQAIRAVPVRHPGRWVTAAVLVALVAGAVDQLATAPGLHWDTVANSLLDGRILRGLWTTLWLTPAAMAIGVVLGVALAVGRLSPNPVLSTVSWLYIWLFRGTPVYVQLIFWANVSIVFSPHVGEPGFLTLGIPFGPAIHSWNVNDLITPATAALLGLGLNEGAYMAEIVRAGIISVDAGQSEAAQGLGMSRAQTMRRIVLPQAMRVIVPPTGNETISMLKTTSLVSVIPFTELLNSAQLIYDVNYRTVELLIVASIWYLVVTSLLTAGQYYVERRFARGAARELPPTPLQRLRRMLVVRHVSPAEVGTRAGGDGRR
ncbi:MAG TPA: amino acid ABC transporter permease [Candidatus Dormibacteraeota bacterium]|nr:amino acid ABC transporter permease [Candidatus Dormibacteraeota bacterium]